MDSQQRLGNFMDRLETAQMRRDLAPVTLSVYRGRERLVPTSVWVAETEVGPSICWTTDWQYESSLKPIAVPFARLARSSDDAIVTFARQYGFLDICPHIHDHPVRQLAAEEGRYYFSHTCEKCKTVRRERDSSTMYFEPIAAWRAYARRVAAILGITADLTRDITVTPTAEDWQLAGASQRTVDMARRRPLAFYTDWPEGFVESMALGSALAFAVNGFINAYGASPVTLEWDHWQRRLNYVQENRGESILCAIALEFVSLLTTEHNIFRCAECKQPYSKTPEANKKRPELHGRKRGWCSAECERKSRAEDARLRREAERTMGK